VAWGALACGAVRGDDDGVEVDPGGPLAAMPFVVGCNRSGLTLVRAMFEAHPDMALGPESKFLVTGIPARPDRFSVARFVDHLFADEQFRRWGLPRTTVELSFHATPPADYVDAVRHVYTLWAAQRGKVRYGDKTGDHVLSLGPITSLFPEARIIHVIRDGRDVAASFMELGWSDNIERAALHWRQRVLKGRQAGELLGRERYLEIRYEDLVTRPEDTLHRLCGHIALPFDPAMLNHQRVAGAVTRTEPLANRNRYLGRPVMPQLRDWRRDQPPAAVDRFEVVAGDLLAELDYELRTPRRGQALGTRLAARSHWLAWHSRRLRGRGAPATQPTRQRKDKGLGPAGPGMGNGKRR
jgi:hypothetical protein